MAKKRNDEPKPKRYSKPNFTFRKLGKVRPSHAPNCKTPFGYVWKGLGDIHIDPRQPEYEMIDTVVHELIHDCLPFLDENTVESTANKIAESMWRLGYRRIVK